MMVEILYDTTTNEVRGWCADPRQFGNFKPKPNEAVVVWDISLPPASDWYEVDLVNQQVKTNPAYVERMVSVTHWARVDSFSLGAVKPLRVKRAWRGQDRLVDCYVSQALVTLYQGGQLVAGDFVIIDFIDGDYDKPLAIAKVFKSW